MPITANTTPTKYSTVTIVMPGQNMSSKPTTIEMIACATIFDLTTFKNDCMIPSSFRYSARHRSRIPKNLAQRRRAKNATNQPIRLVRAYVFTSEFAAR